MILAVAALLLQISAIPQNSISADSRSTADSQDTAAPDTAAKGVSVHGTGSMDSAPASESVASQASSHPSALSPVAEPLSPADYHSKIQRRREWLALTIAQHGAATFDAWSTRRAISSGNAQERDPLLRPFAGNASLYAAIQVGPIVFDYVGRRMITSHHGWMRRAWWVPQVLSTTAFFVGGAHNLSIR